MEWQRERVWRRYAKTQGRLVLGVVLLFWGAAIGGLTWLGFFNWRRLRMTDDFAAIASATLGALLLLCCVEFYLLVKKGVGRMETWKAAAEVRYPDLETHGPMAEAGSPVLFEGIKNLMWMVSGGAALCALMGSDLVLVGVWAAVDEHGPARWLAWGTCAVIIVGIGGVLSYILLKMYLSFWTIAGRIAEIEDRDASALFAQRYQNWRRDPQNAPYHPAFAALRAFEDRQGDGPTTERADGQADVQVDAQPTGAS